MSSFALETDVTSDDYNDLKIVNGVVMFNSGADSIRQHLENRFKIFFAEYKFDETIGVPWFRDILIKKPSFVVVQQILKGVIIDTPGIIELIEFNFQYDAATREASLDFKATTTDEIIDYTQVIEIGLGV